MIKETLEIMASIGLFAIGFGVVVLALEHIARLYKGTPTAQTVYTRMHEADERTIESQRKLIRELDRNLKKARAKIKELESNGEM